MENTNDLKGQLGSHESCVVMRGFIQVANSLQNIGG